MPGSGQVFDWTLAENMPLDQQIILAGGLTPDNVQDAIRRVQPWGVDVSTGVERSPGHKDATKVHALRQRGQEPWPTTPLSRSTSTTTAGPIVEPYDFDWEEDTSVG